MDLLDLFEDEMLYWRYLDYIDQLPRNSLLWSAVADDPDAFDESELDRPEPPPSKPKLKDFSPEVEHLTNIEDLLSQLITAFIAVNSKRGKGPKHKPAPRPEWVGRELAKRRKLLREHEDLKRQLLPHLYK